MNKQQLAAKIWESANKMRSKIEANEYKDYILGFIFYKFLSDKEVKCLKDDDWSLEDIQALNEEDEGTVEYIRKDLGLGYFIAYKNLFSTWLEMGNDFDIDNVRTALSAFSRLINPSHKKVFKNIFQTLDTGLSKLGENARSQTKSVSDLIHLIKDIPMDGKQDYDVLGFIYEYLIGNFAANAGKKAGEFYTPQEVSRLMSEMVAEHLKDRQEIKIYDPTSGSGSLLINIGKSVAKHLDRDNAIQYYAQELKENTYNLTRMNLIMRGIIPENIVVRNGDTLEEDWPYFDEDDPNGTYKPLYVDAVVSNPPYSQQWNPADKESDPRYQTYGIAPKGKADYAFLLHDLYHLKPDGIMNIVLPHGVLFRGGEEGMIRKKLIELNKIDAIIGLPANIFFGTGIPTIIMVLRQSRPNDDVLIIDASKGFIKDGKNNKLRACDIKKIVDAVKNRQNINKFCRVVSREEIKANDYNLNIPRYVDSSPKQETFDIYALMFGGIPANELDEFADFWQAFPNLKSTLFTPNTNAHHKLQVENIKNTISGSPDIAQFKQNYQNALSGLDTYLKTMLISDIHNVNINKADSSISDEIFTRLKNTALIDPYAAYQLLNDKYQGISVDLEIIQTEGFEAIKKVEPNMVMKKKDGKDIEVQDGWTGRILPFELVQRILLSSELNNLNEKNKRISEISSEYEEIMDILAEDDKDKLLNDNNDAFVEKELKTAFDIVLAGILTIETNILEEYLLLSKKQDKLDFISNNQEIKWADMEQNRDGTYGKKTVNDYILKTKLAYQFDVGTYEYAITQAYKLINEEKALKKEIKNLSEALHLATKACIENLSDDNAQMLIYEKWITPIIDGLLVLPENIINDFSNRLDLLAKKYADTFENIDQEITQTEQDLVAMMSDLTGDGQDMQGIAEFIKIMSKTP